MADWSASESELYMLPWQPQWTIHSISFCPLLVACKNISCRITDQCGVPSPHWRYLSKKSPISIWCSTSLIEMSFSLAWSLGSLGPLYSISISQCQQGHITEGIKKTSSYITAWNPKPWIDSTVCLWFGWTPYQVTHEIWFSNFLLYNIVFLDNSPILQYHICRSGESWLLAKLLYHT